MPYRHKTPRVSLRQVRATVPPRVFHTTPCIDVAINGVSARVLLVDVPGQGAVKAQRAMTCPTCGRACHTLGLVDGTLMCRLCGGWQSYNRATTRLGRVRGQSRAPAR